MAKGKFSTPRNTTSSVHTTRKPSSQGTKSPARKPAAGTTRQAPVRNNTISRSAAEKTASRTTKKNTAQKNQKIILISLCSVAAALLIFVVAFLCVLAADPYDNLILENVKVGTVNLGGLTRKEAKIALSSAYGDSYSTENMVIRLPDTTLTLLPADTGAYLDVDAAVKAAYDFGRTGTKAEREAAYAQTTTGSHIIALLPYLNLDTAYIQNAIYAYASGFNSIYIPSSYSFEGEMPALDAENFDQAAPCQTLLLTYGVPGKDLNADSLYNAILDAYSFHTFLVDASEGVPETTPEPLVLNDIFDAVCTEPVEAVMDMETFEVTPETYGYTFDLDLAYNLLADATYGDVIRIPMEYVLPENTAEALEGVLFRDVLGAYDTQHTDNENRNNNLILACKAIDGLILYPGDLFDYNVAVGERTKEAGYKAAAAYDGGKTVDTLGGGICQVSSTLYYCALIADLEIVDRTEHSFVSSYMPMGMDATVSWGGPEFRFRNNTNYPIRIDAEVSDGFVRIQLVGTDEKDYYIEMDYKIIAVDYPETIEQIHAPDNDEGYWDGQILQTPYTGYTVRTYKLKYDKETGQLISKEEDRISVYRARDQIIVKIQAEEETTPIETSPSESVPPESTPSESTPAEGTATEPTTTSTPADSPAEGGEG